MRNITAISQQKWQALAIWPIEVLIDGCGTALHTNVKMDLGKVLQGEMRIDEDLCACRIQA